jgi:hypothetical protein
MRAMRSCATANAVFLGLVLSTFGFAACAGGSTPPESPPAQAGAPTATPPNAPALSSVAPLPMQSPDMVKGKPNPQTPADCRFLVSDITNDPPDGGVFLNNAMTAKDAGSSDRGASMTDIVRSHRDGFRCCFDLWAKTHPGAQGGMKMVIELEPDGAVTKVSFDDAPNRVGAPEIESCMIDLAKGLAYPKSPSGKKTKFTYPFDFKARR